MSKLSEENLVLMPEYMEEFKCIGGACPDNCCLAGWAIDIERDIYFKYKKSKHKNIRESVKRRGSGSSDFKYGLIDLDEKGACPLLDENFFCGVQISMGEDALSETCRKYPRVVSKVDGKFEMSANMSCPEIARIALFKEDGMLLKRVDRVIDYKNWNVFDTEGHLYLNRPERYFWDIRIFAMTLLQNRDYSIDDRLILLGIMFFNLNNLVDEDRVDEIPLTLDALALEFSTETMKKELEKIKGNNLAQANIFKEMLKKRFETGFYVEKYMELWNEIVDYLEVDTGKKYMDARENILKEYLDKKEYILENYLVNEFFRKRMPFGYYKSMWESYVDLCVLYTLLKIHLVGLAGYRGEMNDDLIVDLVYSFSRNNTHNPYHTINIVNFLKENGLDDLGSIAILLKD